MIYKIFDISTDKLTSLTFFQVFFWHGEAIGWPDRLHHFVMQLRPTREAIVTNKDGWFKRKDGVFVDPATFDFSKPEPEWEWETLDNDLPAIIDGNIKAYWGRAEKNEYPVDWTDERLNLALDDSDPHGVLRDDVMALVEKA